MAPVGSPGYSPVQTTAHNLAAPGISEASRGISADSPAAAAAAVGAAGSGSAGVAGASAVAAAWWRQGGCQLQFAVLLLLSIANISVSATVASCRKHQ
jgi:hypothetical protein